MSKTRLKNVTVSLEDRVALWARLEAAQRGISVSRLVGAILKERMQQGNNYAEAMHRALSRKPFLKTDGRYPPRETAHKRDPNHTR